MHTDDDTQCLQKALFVRLALQVTATPRRPQLALGSPAPCPPSPGDCHVAQDGAAREGPRPPCCPPSPPKGGVALHVPTAPVMDRQRPSVLDLTLPCARGAVTPRHTAGPHSGMPPHPRRTESWRCPGRGAGLRKPLPGGNADRTTQPGRGGPGGGSFLGLARCVALGTSTKLSVRRRWAPCGGAGPGVPPGPSGPPSLACVKSSRDQCVTRIVCGSLTRHLSPPARRSQVAF